ncbi:MAG: tRNA 2-thiocytidine biosynthesis protein TtcA, partial [Halanaerobiales bacterium]
LIDYREQSNPCPFDNKSKRAEIKRQLKEFTDDKQIFYNLASAMRRGVPLELWPEEPGKKELSRRMKALWNKK